MEQEKIWQIISGLARDRELSQWWCEIKKKKNSKLKNIEGVLKDIDLDKLHAENGLVEAVIYRQPGRDSNSGVFFRVHADTYSEEVRIEYPRNDHTLTFYVIPDTHILAETMKKLCSSPLSRNDAVDVGKKLNCIYQSLIGVKKYLGEVRVENMQAAGWKIERNLNDFLETVKIEQDNNFTVKFMGWTDTPYIYDFSIAWGNSSIDAHQTRWKNDKIYFNIIVYKLTGDSETGIKEIWLASPRFRRTIPLPAAVAGEIGQMIEKTTEEAEKITKEAEALAGRLALLHRKITESKPPAKTLEI